MQGILARAAIDTERQRDDTSIASIRSTSYITMYKIKSSAGSSSTVGEQVDPNTASSLIMGKLLVAILLLDLGVVLLS